MINLLVEIKNEYLIHIINIISPFIMQGIQGIYNDSLEHITSQNIPDTDIFKIFQIYLRPCSYLSPFTKVAAIRLRWPRAAGALGICFRKF